MNDSYIYARKRCVFARYEPNIKGGMFFLLNKDTGAIFDGNESLFDLYNAIDGVRDESALCIELLKTYNEVPEETLRPIVAQSLIELVDSGIIDRVPHE